MYGDSRTLLRWSQLVGVIETVCETLELCPSQFEAAKSRYEGVGEWLAQSDDPLLASIAIGLQGSVAIGTTVKPIGANEPRRRPCRTRVQSQRRGLAGGAEGEHRQAIAR
jgi:hypothetical protein